MFDFTVRAKSGFWVLQERKAAGRYETREEALAAAGDWLRLIEQPGPCCSATPTASGIRPRWSPRLPLIITQRLSIKSL